MLFDKFCLISCQLIEMLVIDNFCDFILLGEIVFGGWLIEIVLVDQLGVVWLILCMGLYWLVVEGIVVQMFYIGWYVVLFSVVDVWEIWILCGSFESFVLCLVVEWIQFEICVQFDVVFDVFFGVCECGVVYEMFKVDFVMYCVIVDCFGYCRLVV